CEWLSDAHPPLAEAPAALAAEPVPVVDHLARLRVQGFGIHADSHRVLVGPVLGDPSGRIRGRHLGVELDTPGPLPQPVGLRADRAASEEYGALGRHRLVAVPLEAGGARR